VGIVHEWVAAEEVVDCYYYNNYCNVVEVVAVDEGKLDAAAVAERNIGC